MSDTKETTVKATFDLSTLYIEIVDIAETLENAFFGKNIIETGKYAGFILETIHRLHRAGLQVEAVMACYRQEIKKPLPLYNVTIEKSNEYAERA
ncbi:MAG: hypothetical protein IKI30_00220 [Oxalobacter sp.]|nr:hypothetical protein [Oxalobacter sp.]